MRFDTGGQDQKRKKWHLGARSQLLNYISLRARHRSASRANFHHFAITNRMQLLWRRSHHQQNKMQQEVPTRRFISNWTIWAFSIYLNSLCSIRNAMKWSTLRRTIAMTNPLATRNTHKAALRCLITFILLYIARFAIKQHWCGGVTRQVFIASLLNYIRPENHGECPHWFSLLCTCGTGNSSPLHKKLFLLPHQICSKNCHRKQYLT